VKESGICRTCNTHVDGVGEGRGEEQYMYNFDGKSERKKEIPLGRHIDIGKQIILRRILER
jgi:hypothetical protein